MLDIWNSEGAFGISEQRLADQARAIKTNGWLLEIEIEEIERNITGNDSNQDNQERQSEPLTSEEQEDDAISSHDNLTQGRLTNQWDQIVENMRREGCSEEKVNILRMIMDEMVENETNKPPNLRNVDRIAPRKTTSKVNEVIGFIETRNVTDTNMLLVAAANVVAILLGFRNRENRKKGEPWRKRRIKHKIMQLRRDASKLEIMISGRIVRDGIARDLERKYNLSRKGPNVVLEELKSTDYPGGKSETV
jgi:hypothetical protein